MSSFHRVGQMMVLSCLLLPGAAQAKGPCPGGNMEFTPFGVEQLAWPAAALLKTFDPPVPTSSTDEVIRFAEDALSIHIKPTALIRRHQDESCGVLVELLAPGWLPLTEGGLLLPTKTRLWLGFNRSSADLHIWAPETLSIRGTRIGPRLSVNLPDRRNGPLYILTEYISAMGASLRQVEFVEPFVEGGLVWRGLQSRDRGSIRWGTLGEDSLFYGIAVPAGSVLHSPLQPGHAGVWADLPGEPGASRRFWFRHAHLRLDALTTQTPLGRRVQGLVQVGQEAPVLFDVLATPEHTTDCFAFRSERPTGLSLKLNCWIQPPRLETYRRNERGETVVASWDVGSRSVEEQRSTATSASSPWATVRDVHTEPTRRSRSNGPLSGLLFGPVTPASP